MSSETTASVEERHGVHTFKGNPLTLLGPEVKVGQKAPDFQVLAQDLSPVTLADSQGSVRLITAVPSLDTSVCDAQARRFNEEAATAKGVKILVVSMDLPFAQKRWCAAADIDQVQVVSDHRNASFARAYGTWIKELRLLARSVFVIDSSETVRYVEYVPEMTSPPDYEAALTALREVSS